MSLRALLPSSPGAKLPGRRLLPGQTFTPMRPDNSALNCWRCPHRWHGLDCGIAACPCPSAWVDPQVRS